MHDHSPGHEPAAIHGMLVVGEQSVYLSHLPMFSMPAHAFQVVLEATFTKPGSSPPAQAVYVSDRRRHPDTKIYTLNPADRFPLTELVSEDPAHPPRRSFRADIFRGHFERDGELIRGLDRVTVDVTNVIHFHPFDPQPAQRPPLAYVLFGTGDELFMAHSITKRPDFDQVLSVKVQGSDFGVEELRRGLIVAFPEKSNSVEGRVLGSQPVSGIAHVVGESAARTVEIQTVEEIYFEAGELS